MSLKRQAVSSYLNNVLIGNFDADFKQFIRKTCVLIKVMLYENN